MIARTGSVAIQTDNVHYKSDLLLNARGDRRLAARPMCWACAAPTPLFGLLIALWLLWGAWSGVEPSRVNQLMDREWPEEERERFLAAAAEYPELAGLHDLRTRTSGTHHFAQFHVWVPADWTVREAHDRMDRVEEELQQPLPGDRNPDPPRSRGPYRPRDHAAVRNHGERDMTSDSRSSRSMRSPSGR